MQNADFYGLLFVLTMWHKLHLFVLRLYSIWLMIYFIIFNNKQKTARQLPDRSFEHYHFYPGHPPPGPSGELEAALLCFVERNMIEAAVNAVIPTFCIACFLVIFLSFVLLFVVLFFILYAVFIVISMFYPEVPHVNPRPLKGSRSTPRQGTEVIMSVP